MTGTDEPGRADRLIARAGRGGLVLAGWGYLAMTAIIVFDIIARRMLGFSTEATTELTGYLLAFGMTAGLAGTLSDRAHVRIDVLVQKLPLRWRAGLHLASLAVLLVTTGFLAFGAVYLAWDSWMLGATDVSVMRTPLVVPQGLWAAGFVLLLLAGVALMCRCLGWLMAGRHDRIDQALLSRGDRDEAAETLQALGLAPTSPVSPSSQTSSPSPAPATSPPPATPPSPATPGSPT